MTDSTAGSEPRTGKQLLSWLYLNGGAFRTEDRDRVEAAILAIEAEAAHPESAPATSQSPVDLRAALETLDGLATAVIAMKLAIPIGRPLGPEWQAFLARTGDVNRWLDENDRVQGRAALASPDTGVAEEAGPSRTWRLAEGAGLDALPDNACGVIGLCELLKGHEGKHTTSVDRALEGVVLRATHAASPGAFNAPLDVERLARALAASHDEEGVIGALGHGGDPRLGNAAEWGPWAKAYADLAAEVAAAYAHLAPAPEEAPK